MTSAPNPDVERALLDIPDDALRKQAREFLATVDLSRRVPEPTELVDGDDAVRYTTACDYPATSDYGLVGEALRQRPGIRGKRVLEIGPGPGNLIAELLVQGAALVIGAEPSEVMRAYLEEKFHAEIRAGRVRLLPTSVYDLDGGGFDLEVCQNSVHQFFEPEQALKGMVRALRSGGEAHIFDFRRDLPVAALAERISYTRPVIWRDLANSICAALTKAEFGAHLAGIPRITYRARDAEDPRLLGNRALRLIAEDPVPHWRDYRVSQRVEVYRR